jgi:hypothetical protein
MVLKNKKLELEENAQIIKMMESSATENFKTNKDEQDRTLKADLKSMDMISQAERKDHEKEMKEMELMVKNAVEEGKSEMKEHEMDHQKELKEMELMVKDMIEERRLDFEIQKEVSKIVNENMHSKFENGGGMEKQDLNLMIQIAIDQVEENENDEEG